MGEVTASLFAIIPAALSRRTWERAISVIQPSSSAEEIKATTILQAPSSAEEIKVSSPLQPSSLAEEIKASNLPDPIPSQSIPSGGQKHSVVNSIVKFLWNSWDVFCGRKKRVEGQKHGGLAELLSDDGRENSTKVVFQKYKVENCTERNDRSDEGMDGKEKRGLADFRSLYAQNGDKVEPAEHLSEEATILRKSTADGLDSDGGFELEIRNNTKESITGGHIQDVSQNPELDVSAAKHMLEMDTSQKGITSQCKVGAESDGELQPEWSKTASDLSDDVSRREQGAENCVTETERSKAAWKMRNDVSDDVLGCEKEATNGGTGSEQVFMTKIDNKNTRK